MEQASGQPPFPAIETSYRFWPHYTDFTPNTAGSTPSATALSSPGFPTPLVPIPVSDSPFDPSTLQTQPAPLSSPHSTATLPPALTVPASTPTSTPHHSTTAIAVGVSLALSLTLIALLTGILLLLRKLRRARDITPRPTSRSDSLYNDPFHAEMLDPPHPAFSAPRPTRSGSVASGMSGSTRASAMTGLSDWEVELKTAVVGRAVELRPMERGEEGGLKRLMLPVAALPASSLPGNGFGHSGSP